MRRRIIISLGLLLALCLLGDVIAMLSLNSSIRRLKELANYHRIQSWRMALSSDGTRLETDLLARLAGHEHSTEQQAEHVQRFTESLARCGNCHHVPALKAELDAISVDFDAFRKARNEWMAQRDDQRAAVLGAEALTLVDDLVLKTTEMADRARAHLVVRDTDVENDIHNAKLTLYVTLAAVLVCGGLVALDLKGRLTRPVEDLLEGIERVRQGDLDHRFTLHADEEFRALANAFNTANASLKAAQEHMVQTEKLAAIGKLAAGVAHEVSNPLASISSIAQMMRRHTTDQQQTKEIDLIMSEIARISRIVRQMLSFSRPARRQSFEQVQVVDLLEHAKTLIGYDPRAQRVKFTGSLDASLPPVHGDAERLLLVFTNIMINALDAMADRQRDGHTLRITAQRSEDRVVVAFEDSGHGMTREQITHAFEPFYTTKDPGVGTGLGLWMCYQVMQDHNGTIRIDSPDGSGTTVTIELPQTKAARAQEQGDGTEAVSG